MPLTLSRPHRLDPSAVASGKPLNVNAPATKPIANNMALRIMPLGASITYGLLSTDKNGYREDLLNLIQQGGTTQATYVGSRRSGDMAQNAVEGWPGLRIDEVLPKAKDAVPKYMPNVILLNLGTNDCVQDFDLDTTTQLSTLAPELTNNADFNVGTRMQAFVEDLFDMAPNVTVVMSTLILNQTPLTNTRVNDANTQFRSVAAAMQAAGRRVVLADMSVAAGGPNSTTMADGTHPNNIGYSLMANRWYIALTEASNKNMLLAPSS